MLAGAGLPVAEDRIPSDALVDAVVVSGSEAALTDRLGELAESQDELLVSLEPTAASPARRRDEEDALFRSIARIPERG
jgi:hypothetical protein